ncbi:MAG: hypothetical protein K2F63_00175, partial [Muribaculaceae bacterium]|nr:hypothetical protein [Muribaculaceae bacterium]
LYDGWVCTAFDTQAEWDVEMQQNDADPNVLRIVKPYHAEGFPYLQYNQFRRNGYIEFNIADPTNVLFNPVGADFGNSSMGLSQIYCSNDVSTLLGSLGMTVEDMDVLLELAAGAGQEIKFTTLKDGVVDLPQGGVFFGDGDDPYAGYGWQDQAGVMVNMASKITLPSDFTAGISNIVADSNAPVEYFNLQGLRVQNPEAGQILIRRQGEKVSKIIVK